MSEPGITTPLSQITPRQAAPKKVDLPVEIEEIKGFTTVVRWTLGNHSFEQELETVKIDFKDSKVHCGIQEIYEPDRAFLISEFMEKIRVGCDEVFSLVAWDDQDRPLYKYSFWGLSIDEDSSSYNRSENKCLRNIGLKYLQHSWEPIVKRPDQVLSRKGLVSGMFHLHLGDHKFRVVILSPLPDKHGLGNSNKLTNWKSLNMIIKDSLRGTIITELGRGDLPKVKLTRVTLNDSEKPIEHWLLHNVWLQSCGDCPQNEDDQVAQICYSHATWKLHKPKTKAGK